MQRQLGEEALRAVIEALSPETKTRKPCPKCGALTQVKARNRVRSILTVAGELCLSRNDDHCKCGTGFSPRDLGASSLDRVGQAHSIFRLPPR